MGSVMPVIDLTQRQQQVAGLVAEGYQVKEIAGELGVSVRRIEQIISRIAKVWELDPKRSYRIQIAKRAA